MGKLITIASGKGGVGKTTTSINLGAAINSFGKEVIVVDANLTTPNIGLHLGAPIVPISLNHILTGKAKINEAIYEHESGTKIIPSSLSINELKNLNQNKLKEVGKRLRKMSDVVIYDCAAGLGDEAIAAMDAADEIVLVTNPEIPAVTDALKTSKMLEQMGKEIRGVIVTRSKNAKTEMPIINIEEMLELPILGVIPEDERFQSSLVMKDALLHTFPKSRAAREYRKIAAKIIGNNNYTDKITFWDRVLGRY